MGLRAEYRNKVMCRCFHVKENGFVTSDMARSEKNVTVTRCVSEAEQRANPLDVVPRLRVGLLVLMPMGHFFPNEPYGVGF